MSEQVWIELQPRGARFAVQRGTPLQDVLFEHGVEFPCGGKGRCKGCRVRVLSGNVPANERDQAILSTAEIADEWRLACCHDADGDLVLDIGQWEETILADDTPFTFEPAEGLGVAVDVGTTTLVAQLLDRRTGRVLAVTSAMNPQAAHGADIMSRVQFAAEPAGHAKMVSLIREAVGRMVADLLATVDGSQTAGGTPAAEQLRRVVLVGNTVMHHLFCGLSVECLSRVPFETDDGGLQRFGPVDLGWSLPAAVRVEFLPILGSFVGSDLLAGILATRLQESERPVGLVDLGTNGEIIIGDRTRMLCASTAAGPAFEGARITMGMRAATGAISEVRIEDGKLVCHVLGGAEPRGLCGSGLVDAVAAGLNLNAILPTGKFASDDRQMPLAGSVILNQCDVRELQLAKAAIAAGIDLLIEQWGVGRDKLDTLYIAGAFGNYVNLASARRIGLIDWPAERVRVVGNTALLGAKLALFTTDGEPASFDHILSRMTHVPLASDPKFMDAYVDAMTFPEE